MYVCIWTKGSGLQRYGHRNDKVHYQQCVCVCVCVFFPSILDIKFVGRTSRGHTGGRSHRIFNPPSFCGACLDFCREKDSAIPFPRRPWSRILCTNELIVLHPLGIFILVFLFLVRKIPFAGIKLTSQRVRRLRGADWATGVDRPLYVHEIKEILSADKGWVVFHDFGGDVCIMYVCMVITYSRVWINLVRLPILLVVSWTGEIKLFPCPHACLRIWSRETGSGVPSRVSLLISIILS